MVSTCSCVVSHPIDYINIELFLCFYYLQFDELRLEIPSLLFLPPLDPWVGDVDSNRANLETRPPRDLPVQDANMDGAVRTAMAKLFQLGRLSSKQVRLDKVHRTSLYQFLNTRGINMISCIRGAVYFHYIQYFHIFSFRAARKMLLNNLTYFWGHKKASSSKLQKAHRNNNQCSLALVKLAMERRSSQN